MNNSYFSNIYRLYKKVWTKSNLDHDFVIRNLKEETAKSIESKKDKFARDYAKKYFVAREPKSISNVITTAINKEIWAKEIQTAQIVLEWENIVGEINAARTKVVKIENNVIYVQCNSTSYATELRKLRNKIVSKIQKQFPDSDIEDVFIQNPNAPVRNFGPRRVKGRGPRDTYG